MSESPEDVELLDEVKAVHAEQHRKAGGVGIE